MNFVKGRDFIETGAAHTKQPAAHPPALAPHFSGGVAAGAHPATACAPSQSHAVVPGGCAPAFAVDNGRQAVGFLQLNQRLDELWERAYTMAWNEGAVDAGVFAYIRQLRDEGTLSHGQVAAWINRRRERSGYTLLHQIAYHGNYESYKQVRRKSVCVIFFVNRSFRSLWTWERTQSC